MPYVDPATIQATDPGDEISAALLDTYRDNFEFLVEPPYCSVYNSSSVTIGSSTVTAMLANSETFDTDGMHSTVSNTSRITIVTAGRYQVAATVQFDADVDGVRNGKFRVNGSTTYESMQVPAVSASRSCVITCVRNLVLDVDDYVEVLTEHTAANSLAVTLLEFSAMWVAR